MKFSISSIMVIGMLCPATLTKELHYPMGSEVEKFPKSDKIMNITFVCDKDQKLDWNSVQRHADFLRNDIRTMAKSTEKNGKFVQQRGHNTLNITCDQGIYLTLQNWGSNTRGYHPTIIPFLYDELTWIACPKTHAGQVYWDSFRLNVTGLQEGEAC